MITVQLVAWGFPFDNFSHMLQPVSVSLTLAAKFCTMVCCGLLLTFSRKHTILYATLMWNDKVIKTELHDGLSTNSSIHMSIRIEYFMSITAPLRCIPVAVSVFYITKNTVNYLLTKIPLLLFPKQLHQNYLTPTDLRVTLLHKLKHKRTHLHTNLFLPAFKSIYCCCYLLNTIVFNVLGSNLCIKALGFRDVYFYVNLNIYGQICTKHLCARLQLHSKTISRWYCLIVHSNRLLQFSLVCLKCYSILWNI